MPYGGLLRKRAPSGALEIGAQTLLQVHSWHQVLRDTPMADDPLDPSLKYPRSRDGRSPRTAFAGMTHFKFTTSGEQCMRLLKLGKLTPFANGATPYEEQGNKKVPLPNGRCRHIASFSLAELRQLGWDGSMYNSRTTIPGKWVPFVCVYDSDDEEQYEAVNEVAAGRAGLTGLPDEEYGRYMAIPGQGVVQLRRPSR